MRRKLPILVSPILVGFVLGLFAFSCNQPTASEAQVAIDGVWATYGHTANQTRTKKNPSSVLPDNPLELWATTLPFDRFTAYHGDLVIGSDHTIYAPFFGAGWNTGGLQAITSDGRIKWYFKSSETELQAPLVVKRGQDHETLIIFGNVRSMVALYDKDACRCCVKRPPDPWTDMLDYCNFQCEPDPSLCETDPEQYEWRHRLYDTGPGSRCSPDDWNRECGAWHIENKDIDPPQTTPPDLKLEVCATPVLSQNGDTVYYLVGRPNYMVAVDVETGQIKWSLSEDDDNGWIGDQCPDVEGSPFDDPLGTPVLLSDGSIVFGTTGSCLVRIVDYGTFGRAEGIYRYTEDPQVAAREASPVTGLCVERVVGGNDAIYVATHGLTVFHEGFIYKISKDRLLSGAGPMWVYYASRAVTQWSGLDNGGIWRSPALADIDGITYLYACVVDLPKDNPDRGWLVRIPAEDGPGTYQEIEGRLVYQNDIVSELKVGDVWFPARQCTIDGAGRVYVHGGKNQPLGGKLLRLNADLSGLTSIHDTARFGYSEVVLGNDYLVVAAVGAWFPKSFLLPQDWHDRFQPIVYKLGHGQSCPGDFDKDGDVDGMDVTALAGNPVLMDFSRFSMEFGRADCHATKQF